MGHDCFLKATTIPKLSVRGPSSYLARPEAAPPWSSVRYTSERPG